MIGCKKQRGALRLPARLKGLASTVASTTTASHTAAEE